MEKKTQVMENIYSFASRAQAPLPPSIPLAELAYLHSVAMKGDLAAADQAVEGALQLLNRLAQPYTRAA